MRNFNNKFQGLVRSMKVESGLTSSVLLGRDLEIDFRFSDFNYGLRSACIPTVAQQSPTGRVNIYANVFADRLKKRNGLSRI